MKQQIREWWWSLTEKESAVLQRKIKIPTSIGPTDKQLEEMYNLVHTIEVRFYTRKEVEELCGKAFKSGINGSDIFHGRSKDGVFYKNAEDWIRENIK